MENKMTQEQMELFIQMAQLGMACGLFNPIEWYVNWKRALAHSDWKEIPTQEMLATNTFLSFLHGCDSEPDDPVKYLDEEGLNRMIERYYNREKTNS